MVPPEVIGQSPRFRAVLVRSPEVIVGAVPVGRSPLPAGSSRAVVVRHPIFKHLLYQHTRVLLRHTPVNVCLVIALQIRWDVEHDGLAAGSGCRRPGGVWCNRAWCARNEAGLEIGLLLLGRTNSVCRGISKRSRFKSFGFCFNVLSFGHDVCFNSLQCTTPRS